MINSTTTCSGGASSTICTTEYAQSTSTDPTIINGFSAGDIVLITLSFLTFTVICAIAYHLFFRKIKIKNQ